MLVDFSNRDLYNYKYIPYLKEKKRYVFAMGGGWSWKSKFQAQKEIIKTFEKWNRLLWVRKVKDTIKDSIFAELEGVIHEWGLSEHFEITKSPMYIKNKLSWSDVLFRGIDDVEKLKSVKGITRVWIEEATEVEKPEFDQIDLRVRWEWKELQITCTYNPISDQHWLITEFWNKWETDDVALCHSTYKDNRFIWHEQYDKVMERLKQQDIRMYNIYALGIPGKAIEGLIFPDYEIIKEIPQGALKKWYGLDFWYNDPAALVWVYEYNDWFILDEELYRSNMTNQDIVSFMKKIWVWEHEEIIGDSSRPEAIEEIYRSWFRGCKPVKKWKDSIMQGIQVMKQYKIYITARSQNLKKELDNYAWAKDKNWNALEKPIDAFNHAIDASRYWVKTFFNSEDFSNLSITFW